MRKGILAAAVLGLAGPLHAQRAAPADAAPVQQQAQAQAPADPSSCPRTLGKEGCDAYYPDPRLTPGHPDPAVTQANLQDTVCKDHYTLGVRNVDEEEKMQVYGAYNTKPADSQYGYEVDHFISLELGGTNDADNLWPEPYCEPGTGGKTCIGAREKDVVETSLGHRICKGEITLAQAQDIITTDWFAEYLRIKREEPPPGSAAAP